MWTRLLLVVSWMLLLAACTRPAAQAPIDVERRDPAQLFAQAFDHETRQPLDAKPYLAVVEHALLSPDHPYALAALTAALDALVWREVDGMGRVDHAIVYRSSAALEDTSSRLQNAYASGFGHPLMRGLIADALHDLALRVGAPIAAGRWRKRAGCVSRAAVAGPVAWPALTALDEPSPMDATAPMPKDFPGVAPFAARAAFDTTVGDACALPIHETSPLTGMRVVVVDIDNPKEQDIFVALSGSNASVLDIGGQRVLTRPFALGGGWSTRFGRAHLAAGRVRLVLRVAHRHDGNRVAIQLWDAAGEPLDTIVPRAGERAAARATAANPIDIAAKPSADSVVAALAGWLAVGEARRAISHLETIPSDRATLALDLLRVRALESADHLPRNQRRMQVAPAAARAVERCASCWEGRIYHASAEEDRKGHDTGVYAAFAKLGVTAQSAAWSEALGPMELTYVAQQASSAGLDDIVRLAYDALARRIPKAMMLADLDERLFDRHGTARVQAACLGGTSRATTDCLAAHMARSDLRGVQTELRRLRDLRGSKAILRDVEIAQLLAHGKTKQALRIYDALPPATRSLELLGLFVDGPNVEEGRRRFRADMLTASDAPFGYEPLARLLGAYDDPSFALEKEGAALVAADRQNAFLPGAGTAVLRRVERYELEGTGLLRYTIYDLRRVSGTIDVASGTWMGAPQVDGRGNMRALRRRIYKKDGRVLDTDPNARGAQGNTDLAQLQTGDYVEALVVGWALPDDNGQLTVDTPDVLPPRTSIREGRITFRRPSALTLSLWSHSILGQGGTTTDAGLQTTTWAIDDQAPRRMERGVPPLEARAAISFGTDSYKRIAKSLAAHHRTLDEDDPFMTTWVADAVGDETDVRKKVGRIVAAAGKALKRADAGALSDWAASLGGGAQRETARMMIERGVGSRTWVVHRALRVLGIASDIVVSEARPFSAAPGFPPHTGRFTHPLLRATIDGGVVWIDADVDGPPLPPGRVSPELRGRQALLVDGTLVTVEVESDVDVDEVVMDLTLAPSGDASGTVTIKLFGRPAQALVENFEVVVGSQRESMLRSVVLAWVPWADVHAVALDSDETSWEVRINADIKMVGFARPEQRDRPVFALPGLAPLHTVMPASSSTLAARYAQQAERTTALAIDTPLLYRVSRTIRLPAGAKVIGLPKPLDVKRPYLIAARRTEQKGQTLRDGFVLNLPVGTIPPQAFSAFVNTVKMVDDGFLYTTRIELPKSE